MNFQGIHGCDVVVDVEIFPKYISIYLSLNVPLDNSCERIFGGGSKVGCLEPPPLFSFIVVSL